MSENKVQSGGGTTIGCPDSWTKDIEPRHSDYNREDDFSGEERSKIKAAYEEKTGSMPEHNWLV